jgi:hypothetical protein
MAILQQSIMPWRFHRDARPICPHLFLNISPARVPISQRPALVFCPMLWSTKGLTPEQRAEADYLFSQWCKRYPGASRRTLNALYGAAARWAVHGPMPNRNQRLGLRTAKRRREWARMFPGLPYPGMHGVRSPACRRRSHAACHGRGCACSCHNLESY